MKKIFIVLSFVLFILLSGCTVSVQHDSKSTTEEKTTTVQSTTTTTEQQTTTTAGQSTTTASGQSTTTTAGQSSTTTTTSGNQSSTTSIITPSDPSFDLEIHMIDVGQADSLYFKLPNGERMLIDAGNNADSDLVVSYLQSQGVTTLNYVVGTHPHEDHIGGLDAVINAFTIGKVYLPNANSTTQTYLDVLTAISDKGLTITQAKQGVTLFDTTVDGKVLKAVMLSPISSSYSDTNNYSPVIKLTYGTTSYLFTGDAQTEEENEMLTANADLKADVLKVGHHGSSTSTSQSFLDAVDPCIALISVGLNNTYGHPNQSVIDRLNTKGITTFRTDQNGTVVLKSNGKNIDAAKEYDTTPVNPPTETADIGLYINEIFPAPYGTETQEWIEFYNSTGETINLGGYKLDDIAEGGASILTIPDNTIIQAESYYVYYLDSQIFNNSGDDVRLLSPSDVLIDSFTYSTTSHNYSWYRLPDGGSWNTDPSATPTPNAANELYVFIPEEPTGNSVIINEFMANPLTGNEWVELYNPTSESIDLTGYIIDDLENAGGSPMTIESGTIEAHGYYLFNINVSYLNNGGDDVRLLDPRGNLLDKFTYVTATKGKSWYRNPDGGSWSTTECDTPTPGAAN